MPYSARSRYMHRCIASRLDETLHVTRSAWRLRWGSTHVWEARHWYSSWRRGWRAWCWTGPDKIAPLSPTKFYLFSASLSTAQLTPSGRALSARRSFASRCAHPLPDASLRRPPPKQGVLPPRGGVIAACPESSSRRPPRGRAPAPPRRQPCGGVARRHGAGRRPRVAAGLGPASAFRGVREAPWQRRGSSRPEASPAPQPGPRVTVT